MSNSILRIHLLTISIQPSIELAYNSTFQYIYNNSKPYRTFINFIYSINYVFHLCKTFIYLINDLIFCIFNIFLIYSLFHSFKHYHKFQYYFYVTLFSISYLNIFKRKHLANHNLNFNELFDLFLYKIRRLL